jgi:hypothetical protein
VQDWSALHQSKTYAEALQQRVDNVILPSCEDGAGRNLFFGRTAGLGVTAQPFRLSGGAQARGQARLDSFCQPLL